MKKKQWAVLIGGILAALGLTGYILLDRTTGNNVEIESVLPAQTQGAEAQTADAAPAASAVAPDELNGEWNIAEGSKVYWSVTTSRETVNFVNEGVQGSWTVNVSDSAAMKGEGRVDMSRLDSGNAQRDEHVKQADFFDVAVYPEATFTATSFSALPAEWTEGTSVPVEMKGTMTVRGVEKEVVFQTEAAYSGGQLMLSGTTTVTFSDFGLTNPHSIVLETENELEVRLELVLAKQ